MDKWLILLNGGQNTPLPMTDENDAICLFDSKIEAVKTAQSNLLGKARGYIVVNWPYSNG